MDRFSIEELESMRAAYCCMREHQSVDPIDEEMFQMIDRRLHSRRYKIV